MYCWTVRISESKQRPRVIEIPKRGTMLSNYLFNDIQSYKSTEKDDFMTGLHNNYHSISGVT